MGTFFDIFISLSAFLFGLCLALLVEKRPTTKGWRIFLKCLMQLCIIAATIGLYFWYPLTSEKSPHFLVNVFFYILSSALCYVVLTIIGYAIIIPVRAGKRFIKMACFGSDKLYYSLRLILWPALILSMLLFVSAIFLGSYMGQATFKMAGSAFFFAIGMFFILSTCLGIIGWLTLKVIAGLKKYWHWLNE